MDNGHGDAGGDLTGGAHGINFLQIALQVGGGSLLLRGPSRWALGVLLLRVGLSQEGDAMASRNSIYCEEGKTAIGGLSRRRLPPEPILPQTRVGLWAGGAAHA